MVPLLAPHCYLKEVFILGKLLDGELGAPSVKSCHPWSVLLWLRRQPQKAHEQTVECYGGSEVQSRGDVIRAHARSGSRPAGFQHFQRALQKHRSTPSPVRQPFAAFWNRGSGSEERNAKGERRKEDGFIRSAPRLCVHYHFRYAAAFSSWRSA